MILFELVGQLLSLLQQWMAWMLFVLILGAAGLACHHVYQQRFGKRSGESRRRSADEN